MNRQTDRQNVLTEMCRKLTEEDKGDNKKTVHSSHACSLKTKKINQREVTLYKREGLTERRSWG
jgi:hypothetical protein